MTETGKTDNMLTNRVSAVTLETLAGNEKFKPFANVAGKSQCLRLVLINGHRNENSDTIGAEERKPIISYSAHPRSASFIYQSVSAAIELTDMIMKFHHETPLTNGFIFTRYTPVFTTLHRHTSWNKKVGYRTVGADILYSLQPKQNAV